MHPVLAFDQIQTGMLAIVGGKAGNLGEMSRAGLPVPPKRAADKRAAEPANPFACDAPDKA